MTMAAFLMCGCEKAIVSENADDIQRGGGVSSENSPTKKFTFTVKGDFANASFSFGNGTVSDNDGDGKSAEHAPRRAAKYLNGDDNQMTDLWVFDFVGDDCVQSIHQTTADATWGQPQLSLTYGTHHVYFVASRGTTPTVNEVANTLTWEKPSDTFWTDYEVTVVSTSNGNRAVTLDRVVTKLKVTATDEVPTGTATVEVTPTTWYYGMNYRTGEATAASSSQARVVTVPASYIGTSGILTVSIFGFSGSTEWTTDVDVRAKDGNSVVIGQGTISDAPFKRNRATEYSGSLFGTSGNATVSVNDEWLTSIVDTW